MSPQDCGDIKKAFQGHVKPRPLNLTEGRAEQSSQKFKEAVWSTASQLWSRLTPELQGAYQDLAHCASKITGKKLVEYKDDCAEYVQRVADEVRSYPAMPVGVYTGGTFFDSGLTAQRFGYLVQVVVILKGLNIIVTPKPQQVRMHGILFFSTA